jgi:hypothetical protein
MEQIKHISPTANSLSMIRTNIGDKQITGELFVLDPNGQVLFQCYTLELPWVFNQRQVSAIPAGRYPVVPRYSKKYGHHLHIQEVPGRDLILIHQANYVHQLQGCIAVGKAWFDLNKDGLVDVTDSVKTKNRLLEYITEPSQIIIS